MMELPNLFYKRTIIPIVLLVIVLFTVLYPFTGLKLGEAGRGFLTFIVSIVIASLIIFHHGTTE